MMDDTITLKDLYRELTKLRDTLNRDITLCRDRRDVDLREIDQKLLLVSDNLEEEIKGVIQMIEDLKKSGECREDKRSNRVFNTELAILIALIGIIGVLFGVYLESILL